MMKLDKITYKSKRNAKTTEYYNKRSAFGLETIISEDLKATDPTTKRKYIIKLDRQRMKFNHRVVIHKRVRSDPRPVCTCSTRRHHQYSYDGLSLYAREQCA